ncbi:Auracyanin-A precursor [Aquisphaera giovannonii]|uniref:Auracyanin-A n=1 Tax=Aquisphaera giovannonii TaxID=406548 RepID=A0A5B9W5K4_9BACT|nr:PVC-type heme-binding CxxCH protein [Aquisphaera giovannonii]QEH35261.1 Auracyanin-A precursor [Aquisphaera giovannonii]
MASSRRPQLRRGPALAALLALFVASPLPLRAGNFEIRKGDRVALIGNTLADRMQHDGWLETHLQARFAGDDLTFRNLGYAADELTVRLRSKDFGTPDEWLARVKADVIFAFFGYNESFGDPAKLRKDLAAFLGHALAQKYNGSSAPRLVLFSPIAHEDLHDRSLPDGKANNARLERTTALMAEVAREKGVTFVDLFHPTKAMYEGASRPYTINGIHLTADGDRMLAAIIDRALFPDGPVFKRDAAAFERLRQAVLDKDFIWFNRYRTVDGYSMYGGRADLKFVDGQTNRVVMDRELEVLDVMTANRDRRIWTVAKGGDRRVDDGNTPPFIPVKTNKPGAGPNGEHVLLGGEEAIAKMTLGKGLKINLFASEKEFPDLAKPMQMSFDTKGRLWVACWPTYPHWKPKEEMNDKILILEDTDGDGRADRQITFADHLHCPTGFELIPGGVLVAQAPDLMLLKDTDGDDRADTRERVLSGLDSADTHHTSNSFRLDPAGAVYFQEGTFHHTQVETPYGPPVRCANAGVFRYEPRTQKFEVYVTYGFANPHGHVFDRWGQDFVTDGTGNVNYYGTAFSGHLEYPEKHAPMQPYFKQRSRPCGGTEILSSRHFPDDWQGDLLVANVIGFQGIHRYKYQDAGSGFTAVEQEPIVFSDDTNFRPVDIEVGPDGAIYFLDWQNPLIGHMQHNLRDPSRDRSHGRVYRVTYEGRPLASPAKVAGEPIETLLDLLKDRDDRVRYRAKIELGARPTADVLAALKAWEGRLEPADPDFEHHLLEALWLTQFHDAVDVALLDRLLAAKDFRARAAATRVLCNARARVPDALARLAKLAADPAPRVRLEAVRAASFFDDPEALEVALITAEHPSDYYIEYTRGETLRALMPIVKRAIAEGRPVEIRSDAGARYFLGTVDTEALLKMQRSRGVLLEILLRPGIREEVRRMALADLARLDRKPEPRALIDALRARDAGGGSPNEAAVVELARILAERSPADLAPVRGDLERLAAESRSPSLRQLGFAAIVAADGSADRAWDLAARSSTTLRDLLAAVPLIRDPDRRAALYPRIEPLLHPSAGGEKPGVAGRYVRIELPRTGTLTLAEVEVLSDGRNVARGGKARQSSTANDGDAARAIDGNASGSFDDEGQTHTEEDTPRPWWELDLGAELPIDAVVVHNRTDGDLGRRLRGFTLEVLDAGRRPVYRKAGNPAPAPRAAFAIGGENPEGSIRRAAMQALTTIRGHEAETFRTLARFIRDGVDRHAAILALQKIPAATWPADEAPALLAAILGQIRAIPAGDRTSPAALDALQLGDALAALLPADRARAARKELSALGVRVLRVGTVLEQMRYDVDRLVVQAGKPVEILFENGDTMPHNFVVTRPGSLEEVGLLAEATASGPDAIRRQYVPQSDKILLASRLLQPRESQKISFTAPSEIGVHPYVCTYPGHWRRMYGALYVVQDLDEYLASPEGYLAAHPMPAKDELLRSTRPRTEWAFDDLAASVRGLGNDRSFAAGKQLFQSASCASCHKLGGVGKEFGPDLSKLEPRQSPEELLRNILEPSAKINEKYQAYLFELESGQVASGLIVAETPDSVSLVENPLASTEPKVIKKSEIEARKPSTASIMPKGLLDRLTREEILDLVAYVAAGGDPDHALFRGHGHHVHGSGAGHERKGHGE